MPVIVFTLTDIVFPALLAAGGLGFVVWLAAALARKALAKVWGNSDEDA